MPNTIARQCRRPAIGRGPIADWATYDLVQPMCRRCLDVRLAELAARDGLSAAVRFIAEVKPCYRGSRIGPLGQGRKELDAWKAGYA